MKQEHTGSISEAEKYENDDLIENGDNVEKWEDAVSVIRGYKNIIKIKEKNIISVTYRKKKLGIKKKIKKLKQKENFIRMIQQSGMSKSTMICKINIVKIIDKYSKL